MASAGTVGRRVRTAGRFASRRHTRCFLPSKRRSSGESSPSKAQWWATTLARKVPRRALGSRGRINAAAISGAGSYRYRLVRVWNSAEPLLGWVILNPSTPDGRRDDPTVQRCMALSRAWGYGGVDLFAPHHSYGEPDAMKRFVGRGLPFEFIT